MSDVSKKLTASIIAAIILSFCFCITTLAIILVTLRVDNNLFTLGKVDIDLNGGKAVISDNEFLFEPGMKIEKKFYIKNNSTCSVYYKIYFDHIGGDLSDIIEITVLDGDEILFKGNANEIDKNISAASEPLKEGEKKELTMLFYYPENAGNNGQNKLFTFILRSDAVQTRNNPERRF